MLVHDRCKCLVLTQEEIAISEGYTYYCPNCDEDLYAFETAIAISSEVTV